jgi:hypothetical protein
MFLTSQNCQIKTFSINNIQESFSALNLEVEIKGRKDIKSFNLLFLRF